MNFYFLLGMSMVLKSLGVTMDLSSPLTIHGSWV